MLMGCNVDCCWDIGKTVKGLSFCFSSFKLGFSQLDPIYRKEVIEVLNIDNLIEEIEKEQSIEKDNEKNTKPYDGVENGKDEEEQKDLEKEHENEQEESEE